MNVKFDIKGMSCSACAANIEKAVRKRQGVQKADVNLVMNSMNVDFDESLISAKEIISAVEGAGYSAFIKGGKKDTSQPKIDNSDELHEMKKRSIVSIILMVPLMYLSMGHMMGFPLPAIFHGVKNALTLALTQFLLTLIVVYVNRHYYLAGFKALWRRMPNMDSLIATGSGAAVVYGIFALYAIGYGLGHGNMTLVERYSMDLYFESAVMILALVTLGKYLETRAKARTSDAISKLVNLAPKTATVIRNGEEATIPVEEVSVGDMLVIKPGQAIPVDGEVTLGFSSVDESALSGESIPTEKEIGSRLSAGTVNKNGYMQMKATKIGSDTTLAQIIRLVEEANSSKAPISKLADKISSVFVPIVIAIAIVSCAVWLIAGKSFEFALSIGISVLVISCPCALGLATPFAIMIGTGKGAENGILIRSAEALETAHLIDTVVLDKTGTITEGSPSVTDIIVLSQIDQTELVKLAASLENSSEHPLAEAIVREAEEKNIGLYEISDFHNIPGKGISAQINDELYSAGNISLMKQIASEAQDVEPAAQKLATEGKTPIYIAKGSEIIGIIACADKIKPTSAEAVSLLKELNIDVIMLTGDNKRTADAIKSQVGIEHAIAEVLPQDKDSVIQKLQSEGKKVAMVGDGINDAPALARADLGIAVGAGTDIAIMSADFVLMKSDLRDVPTALSLSKKTISNIKRSLFWAFFYNTVGIPVAAGVFYASLGLKLSPMFGAAAMSLSSLCVVANALTLKLFKPKFAKAQEYKQEPQNESCAQEKCEIKGEPEMKKKMFIEGMSCNHCKASVEKALNAIDGVTGAEVSLEEKSALITLSKKVEDDVLMKAVSDIDFNPLSIEEA